MSTGPASGDAWIARTAANFGVGALGEEDELHAPSASDAAVAKASATLRVIERTSSMLDTSLDSRTRGPHERLTTLYEAGEVSDAAYV
jgi:hypothetical protein